MNSPQIRRGFGSGSQVSTPSFYGGRRLEIEAGSRAKCSRPVCKNGAQNREGPTTTHRDVAGCIARITASAGALRRLLP